jgi:hypothetical protein
MDQASGSASNPRTARHLARIVLVAFLLAFMSARVIVFLIMDRRLPDLYLRLGGTHVHHLNLGIFLLAGIGALLLFRPPAGRAGDIAAAVYGVGLALTFDEFGMWFHLGGPYWQRASFDAVVIVTAGLALVAFSPPLRSLRKKHIWIGATVVVALIVFAWLLAGSLRSAEQRLAPVFRELESDAPR